MLSGAKDEELLLGREVELAALTTLLEEVPVRGSALLLRGTPGIGKSRLLGEAATAARERGFTVLSATGVESEAHLPFAGLHQLLRPIRDQARGLLPGQRAALDAAFGRHQLTAQELQIAQLAAEGLSNREIGQKLFVSHRTVGTHLYRIFPKLGISSRGELAGALASDGGCR